MLPAVGTRASAERVPARTCADGSGAEQPGARARERLDLAARLAHTVLERARVERALDRIEIAARARLSGLRVGRGRLRLRLRLLDLVLGALGLRECVVGGRLGLVDRRLRILLGLICGALDLVELIAKPAQRLLDVVGEAARG